MVKEDREYAELIYDYLIEEGTNFYDSLTENEFQKLIRKQYNYIKSIEEEGLV